MSDSKKWKMLSRPVVKEGYIHGFFHPSLALELAACSLPSARRDQYILWLCRLLKVTGDGVSDIQNNILSASGQISGSFAESVSLFPLAFFLVQQESRIPVWQGGRITAINGQDIRLSIPVSARSMQVSLTLAGWITATLDAAAKGQSLQLLEEDGRRLIAALTKVNAGTNNIWAFLKNAYTKGIPYRHLPGKAVQFGYGQKGRRLDSSFTDQTPFISVQMAQNKALTSEVLRQHGLPVQPSRLIKNYNDACALAKDVGYPVVVKPVGRDRGEGVVADIRNEQELQAALKSTEEVSKQIMLEKHFTGKDYRLTVFNHKLLWAVERQPGGVLGDGKHTVAELIHIENSSEQRGNDKKSPLVTIDADEEAEYMLQRQGINYDTVPAAGAFVSLRRISNVSRGGVPVPVMEIVHPDNAELAERAARVLNLDLAGVDLLIPDVSVSWQESGAAICEVNSQPNIGIHTAYHVFGQILDSLLEGDGSVPFVVLCGEGAQAMAQELSVSLYNKGIAASVFDGSHVFTQQQRLSSKPVSAYEAGRMMVLDSQTQVGILPLTDDSVWQHGLPMPYFDILVVTDSECLENFNRNDLSKACRDLICVDDTTDISALKELRDELACGLRVCTDLKSDILEGIKGRLS